MATMTPQEMAKFVAIIEKESHWDNDHLIYSKHETSKYIPLITINKYGYTRAKVLFAHFYGLSLESVRKIEKICKCKGCLNPRHYVSIDNLVDDGTPTDANGWNSTMRRKLWAKLNIWDETKVNDECIYLKSGPRRPLVSLKIGVSILAAVLSLRLKLGRPLILGMQASHLCHHPGCVNKNHLIEETATQNINRSFADGMHNKVKLSDEEVKIIYNDRTSSKTELGRRFGVAHNTISSIHYGRLHSRVTGHERPKQKSKLIQNFQLSEDDRVCIKQLLENGSEKRELTDEEKLINPLLQEPHWLSQKKIYQNGYTYFGYNGQNRAGHILAAVVKYNLDCLPSMLPSEKRTIARHKCTQKSCCNPEHIELGTDLDNVLDKYRDGTMPKPRTTDEDTMLQIEETLKENLLCATEIAELFQVPYFFVLRRKKKLRQTGHIFPKISLVGKRPRRK